MSRKTRPVPGLDPARAFPYYKVQYWDDSVVAWRDIQKAFQSVGELDRFAQEHLADKPRLRIWKVAGYRSRFIIEMRDCTKTERN